MRGRPGKRGGSLPRGEVAASRMVRARVTPAQESRLAALAEREGISASEVLRRLIDRAYHDLSRPRLVSDKPAA